MKFRSFIWLSAIALVLLLIVQYVFITETFQTKKEQFDSKYAGLSKLGLYQFEYQYVNLLQDSIFTTLDDYSYFALYDLGFSSSPGSQDTLKKMILEEFGFLLNQITSRNYFLKAYLENAGEDSDFETQKIVRELTLLSFNKEIPVYTDSIGAVYLNETEGILLNSYTEERNYFRIKYDYYISFTQRSELIAREMRLTITLAIISLLIVFGVFYLTLRNLLIQKRLSALKTDFINNMTHELKTPLSTISVASSSLSSDAGLPDPEKVKRISDIIKKQNKHLSELIDRILDISIWEKDQVRIIPEPVDFRAFIYALTEDFKTTNPGISFRLEMDKHIEERKISFDRVHMTTVLNNLLSNSLKYGGQKPEVKVNVRMNSGLEIYVEDNGAGIPSEEQSQLFEKFFRGKESRDKAIRGLGLGLYYVKQIVEAHEGRISLEKSDSNGSIFKIEIPA